MKIVALDLEGVLIPEIWIEFSKKTGLKEFEITTRDEPDYQKLMKFRCDVLKSHNLKLKDIQKIIETIHPLNGALEFITDLRKEMSVVILSDTFTEFFSAIAPHLMYPTIFCNSLVLDSDGFVIGFVQRLDDGKRKAVESFKNLNFKVFASGDSYNDLSMIKVATKGALFCPPDNIIKENKDIPYTTEYSELKRLILEM